MGVTISPTPLNLDLDVSRSPARLSIAIVMQTHAFPFLGHEEKNRMAHASQKPGQGPGLPEPNSSPSQQHDSVSVKFFIHDTAYVAEKSCQAFLHRSHK